MTIENGVGTYGVQATDKETGKVYITWFPSLLEQLEERRALKKEPIWLQIKLIERR